MPQLSVKCRQHFEPIGIFGGEDGFKATQFRDNLKFMKCEENGVRLLYYSDVDIDYPYNVFDDKMELLSELMMININQHFVS